MTKLTEQEILNIYKKNGCRYQSPIALKQWEIASFFDVSAKVMKCNAKFNASSETNRFFN